MLLKVDIYPCVIHFYRSLGRQSWAESQASIVGSLTLIPTPALESDLASGLTPWTLTEKYDLPRYVVEYRLKVHQDYHQLNLDM